MSAPNIKVFADIAAGANVPYGPYADLSAYVVKASWQSGMRAVTDSLPASGIAELTLKNGDGRFASENFGVNAPYPNLALGRRIEIWLNTVEGSTQWPDAYTLKYVGEIDALMYNDNNDRGQRQCVMRCIDVIGKLQVAKLDAPLQFDKTTDYLVAGLVGLGLGAPADNIQITITTNPNAGDYIEFAYVTQLLRFTYVASAPGANQVLVGASATESAQNLYKAFNNLEGLGTIYGGNSPIPALLASWDTSTGVNVANLTAGSTGCLFVASTNASARISLSNGGLSSGGADWPESPFTRYMQGDLWDVGANASSDSRWYPLNETSGSQAWDFYRSNIGGGGGQNGTAFGTSFRARTDYICGMGYCRYFNGTSDYVNIPPVAGQQNNRYVVSFWVYADSTGSNAQILYVTQSGSVGAYTYQHIAVWYNGGNSYVSVDYSAGVAVNSANGTFQFNKWQLVTVVTRNPGTDIYVNGVLVATDPNGKFTASPTSTTISVAATYTLKGYMSNVFILCNAIPPSSIYPMRWYSSIATRFYDTGYVTAPFAGDDWKASDNNVLGAMQPVVESENGRLYTRGGKLVFRNQQFALKQPAQPVNLTVNNNGPKLEGSKTRDLVYNRIQVQSYGNATSVSGVIAKSDSVITVPGNGSITVILPFIDPTTAASIAARSVTLPLVPTTDWVAALDETGYGSDFYTVARPDYLSFTYKVNAGTIEITIRNTATGPLQMIKFQVRGTGITRYNPIGSVLQDANSQRTNGVRSKTLSLPYNRNNNYAISLGGYWLNRFSNPTFRLNRVTFPKIVQFADGPNKGKFRGGGGNERGWLAASVLALDIESILRITDVQYQITAQKYEIIGLRYQWELASLIIEAQVARLDDVTYWILGDSTYGVIGSTARLGI